MDLLVLVDMVVEDLVEEVLSGGYGGMKSNVVLIRKGGVAEINLDKSTGEWTELVIGQRKKISLHETGGNPKSLHQNHQVNLNLLFQFLHIRRIESVSVH